MIQVDRKCVPALIFMMAAPGCYGQAVAVAEVQGQISDVSGAVVPGAQIRMTQISTRYVRSTTAGVDGNFNDDTLTALGAFQDNNALILLTARLPRKSLNGLDRLRWTTPSQKFKFLIFERIGSFEKFLQLRNRPCWKTPHVLQIALKRRAVGYRENPVVSFFLALGDLKNFEHPNRCAAE